METKEGKEEAISRRSTTSPSSQSFSPAPAPIALPHAGSCSSLQSLSLSSLSLSSSPPYPLKTAKRMHDGAEFDELDKVDDVPVVAPQLESELSDQLFFNKRVRVITKTSALKIDQEKIESPKH